MADQIFSVNAGFFDAIDYDRTYSADDMNKPYSRIVADGVFATPEGTASDDLQVIASGTGMSITVQAGQGIFAGKWFENPSAVAITVPANTSLYTRVDSVIVQVDKRSTGRVGNIVYRTGTAASEITIPDINTVANVVEYRIANISVAAGATSISGMNIADLRGSSSCPWVAGLIEQVDTSTLMEQYRAAYQDYYNAATTEFSQYMDQQRAAWQAFIETLTQDLTVTTNVILYSSIYSATESTTSVPIGISSYNHYTDILQVFINGLLLVEDVDYTIDSDYENITLTHAVNAGNDVNFICFKSVIGADIESTVTLIKKLDNKVDGFMADSGWLTITLGEGITAYDDDSTPMMRCVGNRLYIRGAVKGTMDTGTTLGTLPIPYRPQQDYIFSTSAFDSSGGVNDGLVITVSATDRTIKLTAKSGDVAETDKVPISAACLSATGNTSAIIYTYCGSVSTYADLPASDVSAGDYYMVLTADSDHYIAAGDSVMWNGTDWEVFQACITSGEISEIIDALT